MSKDPDVRVLQAKIEELQQMVQDFHNKHNCHERENKDLRRDFNNKYQVVEKQNEDLKKEIIVLKRQRTDSFGSAITTASTSRSSTASYPSSRSRERYPADFNQQNAHQSRTPSPSRAQRCQLS